MVPQQTLPLPQAEHAQALLPAAGQVEKVPPGCQEVAQAPWESFVAITQERRAASEQHEQQVQQVQQQQLEQQQAQQAHHHL